MIGTHTFQNLSKSWWAPHGPFSFLNMMNPVRNQYIKKFYTHLAGKYFLDIGCGGGLTSEMLAQQGAIVKAIDVIPETLDIARKRAKQHNLSIDYQCLDIQKINQHTFTEQWDCMVAFEVFEHVASLISVLSCLRQHIKPDGLLICSTLNRTLSSYILGIMMAENVLGIVPKGSHQWSYFLKPCDLKQIAQLTQWRVINVTGIRFYPFKAMMQVNPWKLGGSGRINYMAALAPIR